MLFVLFLLLSMQMHRLIFNAHNTGMIPETCTTKGQRYKRYPDYPWKVYLGQQDHVSACGGRDEEIPAPCSPLSGRTVLSPRRLRCVLVPDGWMLKQGRGQESVARNRAGWDRGGQNLCWFWPLHGHCRGETDSPCVRERHFRAATQYQGL